MLEFTGSFFPNFAKVAEEIILLTTKSVLFKLLVYEIFFQDITKFMIMYAAYYRCYAYCILEDTKHCLLLLVI